jgi:hypothetical protein
MGEEQGECGHKKDLEPFTTPERAICFLEGVE